jgi:hypothetical protein
MQEKEASQRWLDAMDKLRDQPPDSDQGKKLPQVEGWQQRQSLQKPGYWQNKEKQRRNQRMSHCYQGLRAGE